LILPAREPLATDAFARQDSQVLNVWLRYGRKGSDEPIPPGYRACGDDGQLSPYRWQEKPWVWLQAPKPDLDPSQPPGVPEGDWEFSASRQPPDDPQVGWPVFLGRIEHDPANTNQPYSIDMSGRPYAGLVGATIVAPSGRTRVQLEAEPDKPKRRFAVVITKDQADTEPPPTQLEIDQDGKVSVLGQTTLEGNLYIKKGAIEFEAGTANAQPGPWQIYRTSNNEMRIEIDPDSPGSSVVIGYWRADSPDEDKFKACLTAKADGTVIVDGTLIVRGDLKVDGKGKDLVRQRRVAPSTKQMITGAMTTGLGSVGAVVGQAFDAEELKKIAKAVAAQKPAEAPEVTAEFIEQQLKSDKTLQESFIKLFAANPEFIDALKDHCQETNNSKGTGKN
jgi:hypothetical protein